MEMQTQDQKDLAEIGRNYLLRMVEEFLNCQLPATYYHIRGHRCLMDSEAFYAPGCFFPSQDAFDPHLYDHVAILQQWLNRFATARFIADGFGAAAIRKPCKPILILQHFDGVDRWPPPT